MNIYDSLRSRPLRRTPDKLLGGLCSGLAHRWGISPVLVRIGMILLMLVGGLGLVVYGLGWLFVPDYETDEIVAEGALRNPDAAVAAAVILILVGATVFIPFAGAWIFAALDRAPFVLVIIGIVVVFAFLMFLQRRERKEYMLSPTLVGPLPQPEDLAPQTTPMPRPIKAPRPKKPALSARAIYLFLAAALIGVALALLFTPGKVASILMAFAVGLAVVAAGVIYAGLRGLRATWLTALTWVLALPTAAALSLAMVLPTYMLTSPNLELFNHRGTSGPTLFGVGIPTVNVAADTRLLSDIDTFLLTGASSAVAEDVPLIYDITRHREAIGPSRIYLSGSGDWAVHDERDIELSGEGNKNESFGDVWWQSYDLGPGQTIRVYTPAAVAKPADAKRIKITYSQGGFEIFGQVPDVIEYGRSLKGDIDETDEEADWPGDESGTPADEPTSRETGPISTQPEPSSTESAPSTQEGSSGLPDHNDSK